MAMTFLIIRDIDPMFGSVEDMEALIKEAKKYNIRIIMDLVLNHTSNKHRWFEEAKKSKDNPYHDYYVWRDGEEGVEPNDMKAVFGGSAWNGYRNKRASIISISFAGTAGFELGKSRRCEKKYMT